ncbi:MAG: hypothetical protein QNJ38_20545 [Prochloraceae cyanobacterium]|nr:hypothetical protein [Prochloraceae cyanobacterium]
MTQTFIVAPRYILDDESVWLEGIDPSRHYWLFINGDRKLRVAIPGLYVSSFEELKENILGFRNLKPQEKMEIKRISGSFILHCVSSNCYAIEGKVAGAEVWHLFDRESIESLLMTGHPDWVSAPEHIELGRRHLANSFKQPAYT